MSTIHPKNFDICLYHAGCPDGTGAAWCFWRENRERIDDNDICDSFILQEVKHNEPYPKIIKGKNVVIVDFSYDRDTIKEICAEANYLLILDHHDTAQRNLQDLDKEFGNFSYIFDMSRSGAQIAWDWCYPEIQRPWFIEIIADRDLWKWEIPYSKEIGKALFYYGWYTFSGLEKLYQVKIPEISRFAEQGKILTSIEAKNISHAVGNSVLCNFEGHRVRIATCSPLIRSEVGNALCDMKDCQFAATWRYSFVSDQWWVSLRASKDCKIPLNVLCEKYGGGGHPRACGFAIHGIHSAELAKADEVKKEIMARGNLWSYFTIVR